MSPDEILKSPGFPSPASGAFVAAPWQQLLDDVNQPDETRALAKLALRVAAELAEVRLQSQRTYGDISGKTSDRVLAYLAFVNNGCLRITAKGNYLSSSAGSKGRASVKIESGDEYGSYTPDEGLSGLVDGSRFSLYELMSVAVAETGIDADGREFRDAIGFHYRAGQIYDAWYGIWQAVLFGGLRPTSSGRLRYRDAAETKDAVLANYRSHRRIQSAAMFGAESWVEHGRKAPLEYGVANLDLDKRGFMRFKLTKGQENEVPFQFLMRMQLGMEVSDAIFATRLPRASGIAVNTVIRCWSCIAAVVSAFVDSKLQALEDAEPSGENLALQPSELLLILDRLSLISDIHEATGLPRGEIASAVKLMTYDGSTVKSLWGRPLISVGADAISPMFAPFLSGTYLYPCRAWFLDGGADVALKGSVFEKELGATLSRALDRNPELAGWRFVLNARVSCRGVREEIDLLIVTTTQIFVIEAKCLLPGYEPREVRRYGEEVEHAVAQAKRKASALADNRSDLTRLLRERRLEGRVSAETCLVSPLVVLYHPLGIYKSSIECPVADSVMFERFFGNLTPAGYKYVEGRWVVAEHGRKIYASEADADRVFYPFMAEPPIIREYRQALIDRPLTIVGLDGSSSGYVQDFFEVGPLPSEGRGI